MRPMLAALAIVLLASPALSEKRLPEEQRIIRSAMQAKNCEGTEKIMLRLGFSPEELLYTERCWSEAQKRIVPPAMAKNDCAAVESIPGIYPLGADAEKRFVYHCWMDAGLRDLDSCIGITEAGDATSIPHIVRVLRRNPPRWTGRKRLAMIDTAAACLVPFARIQGLSDAQVRAAARDWGGNWRAWASER